MTGFDDLDDAAKVSYSQAELAATFSELTAALDRLAALRTEAADPDGDVERYFWDITDCQGKSVLPGGGRTRRGLFGDRISGEDTATVFGAIELGLPDADLQGRCTSIRVEGSVSPRLPA